MMLYLLPYCVSTRALEQGNTYSILAGYFSAPADDNGEDIRILYFNTGYIFY